MDAYAKSKTPPEKRDLRATPWPVYRAICDTLQMEPSLDVAAEESTALARNFVAPPRDALSIKWTCLVGGNLPVAWMNPPYSNPLPWVEKAAREAARGMFVIGLLPEAGETQWWRIVEDTAEAIFTTKRISFLLDGEPQHGNPKAGKVVLWAPWPVRWPAQGWIDVPSWQTKAGRWSWLPPSITDPEISGAYRPGIAEPDQPHKEAS